MYPLSIVGKVLIVAVTFLPKGGQAQACAIGTAQEINGNWYCSKVEAITYKNFPGKGSYNKVTGMDVSTGQCTTEAYTYSGSLSPLNEELSVHIRGPTWLKQVAVYTPEPTSNKKRTTEHGNHGHRHNRHQNSHNHHGKAKEVHRRDLKGRSVGQIISATIDGQVVSWTNEYSGTGPAPVMPSPSNLQPGLVMAPAPDPTSNTEDHNLTPASTAIEQSSVMPSPSGLQPGLVMAPVPGTTSDTEDQNLTPASTAIKQSSTFAQLPTANLKRLSTTSELSTATLGISSTTFTSHTPASASSPASGGSWIRQAYYTAGAGTVEGLTFLNHFGGTDDIPGTAAGGPPFGASLSYASSDGQSGAATPQTLSNVLIEDNVEVLILSNRSCDDGGCGFTRPGGVNYHGFGGSQKLFLFEFSMPLSNKTGFNEDMPALWLLNTQIPLTSQYGTNPDCSCWTSGCGEFDLFEVLDSGNFRCKSTLHMAPAGGSSDWFQRPFTSITAAVIIGGSGEVATIRVLDQSVLSFEGALTRSLVDGWVGGQGSVFDMSV